MADQYTEITRKSWGSRIKGSVKGIFIGILFIIGGIILLFWNEGRTINNKRALKEGLQSVVSINPATISSNFEGKLVHFSGFAQTVDTISDIQFGIQQVAISLHRSVEMYQWIEKTDSETDTKVGGAEETKTTYTYAKDWSSSLVSSAEFKKAEGHQNPSQMPYDNLSDYAENVTLGAFTLPYSLISKISVSKPINPKQININALEDASVNENYLYIGKGSFSAPEVGDIRISFSVVEPQTISVIAKQTANTLEPYTTSGGKNLMFLKSGVVSSDKIFQQETSKNKNLGWILRLVGFLLISGGFGMILKPLKVLADVVPFIGSIVNAGIGLISGILGFAISFVVISVGWIFYRPVLGISLLVIGIAAIIYFFVKLRKQK